MASLFYHGAIKDDQSLGERATVEDTLARARQSGRFGVTDELVVVPSSDMIPLMPGTVLADERHDVYSSYRIDCVLAQLSNRKQDVIATRMEASRVLTQCKITNTNLRLTVLTPDGLLSGQVDFPNGDQVDIDVLVQELKQNRRSFELVIDRISQETVELAFVSARRDARFRAVLINEGAIGGIGKSNVLKLEWAYLATLIMKVPSESKAVEAYGCRSGLLTKEFRHFNGPGILMLVTSATGMSRSWSNRWGPVPLQLLWCVLSNVTLLGAVLPELVQLCDDIPMSATDGKLYPYEVMANGPWEVWGDGLNRLNLSGLIDTEHALEVDVGDEVGESDFDAFWSAMALKCEAPLAGDLLKALDALGDEVRAAYPRIAAPAKGSSFDFKVPKDIEKRMLGRLSRALDERYGEEQMEDAVWYWESLVLCLELQFPDDVESSLARALEAAFPARIGDTPL